MLSATLSSRPATLRSGSAAIGPSMSPAMRHLSIPARHAGLSTPASPSEAALLRGPAPSAITFTRAGHGPSPYRSSLSYRHLSNTSEQSPRPPNPSSDLSTPPPPSPPPPHPTAPTPSILSPPASPSTPSPATPPAHTGSKPPRGLTARYAPRLNALSQRTGVPLPALAASFLVLHELTAILPLGVVYWILQALGAGAGLVVWLEGVVGDAEGGSTGQGVGAGVSVSEERADVAGSEEGERHGAGAEAGIGVMVVVARKVREWMTEGGERVERVGRRYGILGFDKAVKDSSKGGGYSADAKANCARSDGAFGGQAGTSTAGSVPAVVSGDVAEAQSTVDEVAQVAGGRATGAGDRVASAITAYVIVKALLPIRICASLALAPAFARLLIMPYRRAMTRWKARPGGQ